MENVSLPFTFTLNWNPSYSYATIPKEIKDVPQHWVVLNTPVVPIERGFATFRRITIENTEIVGADRIFTASGLPEKKIADVKFINVSAEGREAGTIEHAHDWSMKNVKLRTASGAPVKITNSTNVDPPEVVKR
jgi:hypothetical protein